MGPAALLSVGLHVALIGLAVLWARHHAPVALVPMQRPATVQLVMSPPGGETPPDAAPQAKPAPTRDAAKARVAAPKALPAAPTTPRVAPAPAAAPPAAARPARAPPAAAPRPPAPPSTRHKLRFDFADTESDTNALVTGDLVVPASPDVKFHNRKPSYPMTAALEGEQGAVVLVIHVSREGLVSGVDVVRSSGFAVLDRAARDAVLTWHFLPSVKNGQPVPAEVPMRFVFALD
ncbi:MAG TPA: TonB family protein [Acetobacteraceae bacterium]|nr:TonB family protein [Acetobacteraceae bacterium]